VDTEILIEKEQTIQELRETVEIRPGPPGAVKRLNVFLCESVLYGAFVWARRALNS
jgi:hypothetical protein